MRHLLRTVFLILSLAPWAAQGAGALSCYQAGDGVGCFLARAHDKARRVADPGRRADALAELLYTTALTGRDDPALLREAMALAGAKGLAPYREMGLLYAIDLYQFAAESPLAEASRTLAVDRFRALEKSAGDRERLDLYTGACSMLGWDEAFLERWAEFLHEACSAEKLGALKLDSAAARVWVLAMLPSAWTAADEWESYLQSASAALSWLDAANKAAQKSAAAAERNFLDETGVVMYSLNAIALDLFDESAAAAGAVDRSLGHLRRLEKRVGVSGESAPLRRQVAENLIRVGREAEAKKLIRQLLARVDGDPAGKRIPLHEQVAILALAANVADLSAAGMCPAPREDVKET